jgi:3D (Asp-Asp-Asp) domain-containing protein
MKRFLACLATLSIAATGSAAFAQQYDPIGDVIAATEQSAVENATDWRLKATLYHGGGGMSSRDSLGCRVVPMRTVAVDRGVVSRRTIIFIKETVGLPLPDGTVHDGYWYVSDTGGAIRGSRIDLFTGPGAASMRALMGLNLKTLTISRIGEFTGCPPTDGGVGERLAAAQTHAAQPSSLDERPLKHEVARLGDGAFLEAAFKK